MGRRIPLYLNAPRVYVCCKCQAHLTSHDQIISKVPPVRIWFPEEIGDDFLIFQFPTFFPFTVNMVRVYQLFQGRHGKAYLFDNW